MNKFSEKMYTFTISIGGGESSIQWDPNQGLDDLDPEACAKGSDLFLKGPATKRKRWSDKKSSGPPPDPKRKQLNTQQQQQA